MLKFLKTTVLGGILFLVPIIIFIAIIGKALQLSSKLAFPLAGLLGFDKIIGIAAAEILAVFILVLICFLAGLAAKTLIARQFVQSLEENVLEKIPAYEFLKAKTQSALNFEQAEGMRPVLVQFDDAWQLAFEIERTADDKIVVFLPGSPDPWSGSVCFMTAERITPLDLPVKTMVNLMKRLGKGTTDVLPGIQDCHAGRGSSSP